MKLEKLYKRATNGKTSVWCIEIDGNRYRSTSGYTDGAKTTSEWTYCAGKNVGRANETSAAEQAEKAARSLWQKKVDGGYFANISNIDKKAFFSPMLAKDWNDYKDGIKFPLYSQPKLDGIRCIVKQDGMWTRNGKRIVSAPHIFEAMESLFKDNPSLIFDGELYADKFANDFNAICSLVKKTKPTTKDFADSATAIEYHIYDLPSCEDVFTVRSSELASLDLPECCVLVATDKVVCMKDVDNKYEEYVHEGYEGQILRQDTKYENKRTKSLLKHKSFQDDEYTILDVCEGEGNKAGMVGFMVFQSNDGIPFKSNVKANWELATEMWKNRKALIGKEATIKYFNLTPDGVPRFPYVIAVRDYE